MAIKAKVIVVGGNKFVAEAEAGKRKSPQDLVTRVGEPELRPEPPRIEHDSPQDMVEIIDEPRVAGTKNSFILKHTSKFYRDMIDE